MSLRRLLILALLAFAPAAGAQQIGGTLDPGTIQSPILVIDFERMFEESRYGASVAREIEEEGAEIAAENRRIEAELIEEERALTKRRSELPPDEFRALANAFDEKVTRLRDEQDAKARNLGNRNENARRRFAAAAQPVLSELMRSTGAAVILERRAVFVAADSVDVTATAIRRIDVAIGDGEDLPPLDAGGEGSEEAAPDALPEGIPAQPEADAALP